MDTQRLGGGTEGQVVINIREPEMRSAAERNANGINVNPLHPAVGIDADRSPCSIITCQETSEAT